MTDTLFVKAFPLYIYDAPSLSNAAYIYFTAPNYFTQPNNYVVVRLGHNDPAATPLPYFVDVPAAIAYYKDVQGQALVDWVNMSVGAIAYTNYDVEITDQPTANFIASLSLDTIPAGVTNKPFTAAEKAKLAALAAQVNSDWNASSGPAQILNKPSIPAAQIQSDWNQASTGAADYIKNKPTITGFNPVTSALTLSPVAPGTTTGGNTGVQISASQAALVSVTYSTQITYSLSGNVVSNVTLKKCATNDPVEANWTACGETETSQNTGLAVTVGQVVGAKGQITMNLPAGWFIKAVKTGSGTHTEAFLEGEKTIYN